MPDSAGHSVIDQPTGQRFLKGPDGTARLGDVPAFEGALHEEGDFPIQLRRSDVPHVDTPGKRVQAQSLGYRDGLDLTRDVSANWTEVYQGRDGRLVLAIPNGQPKVAELGKDGNSYRIVSAGLRLKDQLPNEPLWQRVREPSETPAGGAPPASEAGPAKTGGPSNFASGQSGP
jgi:hypothetical protein